MAWRDRWRRRPSRDGARGTLDRTATAEDLEHLRAFARSRPGVEFYVEPKTSITAATAVAVAADGEWTRRRVGSPEQAAKLARQLELPVYDAAVLGYPRRMREYDRRRRDGS